jgi:hypothetical protein
MHAFSFQLNFTGIRGIFLLLYLAALFVLVWIRLSTDSFYSKNANQVATGGFFGGWHRQKSLTVPFVGLLVFSIVVGADTLAVKIGFLLAALLMSLWIRYIFRKTSGAAWVAALVFSAMYTILAFG